MKKRFYELSTTLENGVAFNCKWYGDDKDRPAPRVDHVEITCSCGYIYDGHCAVQPVRCPGCDRSFSGQEGV